MATGRRHRRRSSTSNNKPDKSKRTTSFRGEPASAMAPTTVDAVPDHILELVLLHLHSSACLLRAAATCKRWCRLVADTVFLTRFRSLNTPRIVAGTYHAVYPDRVFQPVDHDWHQPRQVLTGNINPVFVPSSSSSSPAAVVDRRRFSLDFLPDSVTGWEIADSRGSLLLFKRRANTLTRWHSPNSRRRRHFRFPDLVVCEPLTRRSQGILCPAYEETTTLCLGVFLLDGGDDRTGGRVVGMSNNFRILSVLHETNYRTTEPDRSTPTACVFSPGSDGGWRVLPTRTPNDSAVTIPDAIESISFVGCANGSIYWAITGEDRSMLAFDEDTAEFSRFLFPAGSVSWGPHVDRRSLRVVGGEDGALRVIRVIGKDLKVFVQGGEEWMVEKSVRLSGREEGTSYFHFDLEPMIVAANDKFVLLTPQEKTWPFSVELDTMKIEREHERNRYPGEAHPCQLPWPPVLKACTGDGRGGRRRR